MVTNGYGTRRSEAEAEVRTEVEVVGVVVEVSVVAEDENVVSLMMVNLRGVLHARQYLRVHAREAGSIREITEDNIRYEKVMT